jgi:hypothetical protein
MHVCLFETGTVGLLKACANNILEGLGFIRVFKEYGISCLLQSSALSGTNH